MKLLLDIPYVPSAEERCKIMFALAEVKPGEKTIDLGSGDGRVVIGMARRGAEAYGVEIEPKRVKLGQNNLKKTNLEARAQIFHASFWDLDLSEFDVITLYGISSIMKRLEKKLQKELKPGARVVSNYFTFPNWKPAVEENHVYLYIKN
jgi:precorrin-6B methylase 2